MARKMVTIQHDDIEDTARVPETALQHLGEGWKVVEDGSEKPDAKPAKKVAATHTEA